jgi:hypothetical protein
LRTGPSAIDPIAASNQPRSGFVCSSLINLARVCRANEIRLGYEPAKLLLADAADAELNHLASQPRAKQQLDQACTSPELSNNPFDRRWPVVGCHDEVLREVSPVSCPTNDHHAKQELQRALPVPRADYPGIF